MSPIPSCSNCGSPVEAGQRFCTSCGYDLVSNPPSMRDAPASAGVCTACGGNGALLPASAVYCGTCRWLRPLSPDYALDVSAFTYELDAHAMGVLQSLGPLTDLVRAVSDQAGLPWFEAAINGVRLGERQLPDVFSTAIRAARIFGLSRMPEIYVSGEQGWDSLTMGSDDRCFIGLGSVLTFLKEDDLLFLLAREMGHIRAGHVLWKTAARLLTGSNPLNRSIMSGGLLKVLNPARLAQAAIDAPLMAWARHSEITADRAGMLAVASDDVARKVVMSVALRSFTLYPRINADEWLAQEQTSGSDMAQFSEAAMTTMPFLARRMALLRQFGTSDQCLAWRSYIHGLLGSSTAAAPSRQGHAPPAGAPPVPPNQTAPDDVVRFACTRCHRPMRVPRAIFEGKSLVRVRCAAEGCGAIMHVRPRPAEGQDAATSIRVKCGKCGIRLLVPRAAFATTSTVHVRCPEPGCRCVLEVTRQPPAPQPAARKRTPAAKKRARTT